MKTLNIVSGSLLMLGLSAAATLAQPADAPRNMAVPALRQTPRVRPTEPGKQITGDLMDFAAALGSNRIYPNAQKWVCGARIGFFGAQEWGARLWRQSLERGNEG